MKNNNYKKIDKIRQIHLKVQKQWAGVSADSLFLRFDNLRQTINIKSAIIIVEVIIMQNEFIKSLQVIKILGIRNQKQYKKMSKNFLVLSPESLKYMSQKRDFKEIVEMAEEYSI